MAGKGDKQRPRQVDGETYAENWQRTFGKKPHMEYAYCPTCQVHVFKLDTRKCGFCGFTGCINCFIPHVCEGGTCKEGGER